PSATSRPAPATATRAAPPPPSTHPRARAPPSPRPPCPRPPAAPPRTRTPRSSTTARHRSPRPTPTGGPANTPPDRAQPTRTRPTRQGPGQATTVRPRPPQPHRRPLREPCATGAGGPRPRPDRPAPTASWSPATPPTTGHAPPERPRLTPAPGTGSPSRSDGRGRAAEPHPRTPSHRTPHQQTRPEHQPTTTRPTPRRPLPDRSQHEKNPSSEDSREGRRRREEAAGTRRTRPSPRLRKGDRSRPPVAPYRHPAERAGRSGRTRETQGRQVAHYSISAQVNPLTTPSSGYQQNTAATRPSSPAGSGPETPVSRAGPPPTPHPEPAATPGGSGPPQPPARPAHTPSRRATATSAAPRRSSASAHPAAANPPRTGGPRWPCAPGPH